MHISEEVLTPTVFHILLALARRESHGYQIIKQAEADSGGSVRLLTGTLYGALKRLLESGFIEESDGMSDDRKRTYRLTEKGKGALGRELRRYEEAVAIAKSSSTANLFPYGTI